MAISYQIIRFHFFQQNLNIALKLDTAKKQFLYKKNLHLVCEEVLENMLSSCTEQST